MKLYKINDYIKTFIQIVYHKVRKQPFAHYVLNAYSHNLLSLPVKIKKCNYGRTIESK